MNSLMIMNASVIVKDVVLKKHAVYCENGKIESMLPSEEIRNINADNVIDAKGMLLCPGFIDLHIHGMKNLLTDDPLQLQKLCSVLPQYGVTSFLAGVCPLPNEQDDIVLLKNLAKTRTNGSNILGFFLEGHYLALPGAISIISKNKSRKRVLDLIEAAKPYRLVFAISPEIEGITRLIPDMTAQGYPAFITHTAATAQETKAAITAGAVHATHFYDVFPYPGDKEPGVRACGVVEAVMANCETSVDFVLDGEHVDPVAVEMALVCKGNENVCLITDSNVNAGLSPGSYSGLGGNDVDVLYEGGPARLGRNTKMPGSLAGSGLTMDIAIRNAIKFLDVDIIQAVAMATYNPAKVLGIHRQKGCVAKGYDADMVLLDKNLKVVNVWVGGNSVYSKDRVKTCL